jgi:hypothetical protein
LAALLKIHGTTHRPGLTALLARRPTKVAAIALANKIVRMASKNRLAKKDQKDGDQWGLPKFKPRAYRRCVQSAISRSLQSTKPQ